MAGMYLGEIVRYVLLDLCERGIVFNREALAVLGRKGKIIACVLELQLLATWDHVTFT